MGGNGEPDAAAMKGFGIPKGVAPDDTDEDDTPEDHIELEGPGPKGRCHGLPPVVGNGADADVAK